MNCDDAIRTVAERLGLSVELCRRAYAAQWLFIKNTIKEIPLKTMKVEELDNYRTSFNIPSIGKLGILKNDFKYKREAYERICLLKNKEDDKSKRNQAPVQSDCGDKENL